MKKLLIILTLLIFFISACTQDFGTPLTDTSDNEAVVEEDINESETEPFELNEMFKEKGEYEIQTEPLSEDEGTFRAYLSYGDTRIFELPWTGAWNAREFLITKVFKRDEKDIVFLTVGAGCGGCIAFLDKYFVIDKSDLSVDEVDFKGPSDFDISPMYAIFADAANEMAYVQTYGDLYNYNNYTYYEEVWVYLFDTNEWKLVETIDNGETVMCESMGLNPDPKDVFFWKKALMLEPDPIEDGVYCEN